MPNEEYMPRWAILEARDTMRATATMLSLASVLLMGSLTLPAAAADPYYTVDCTLPVGVGGLVYKAYCAGANAIDMSTCVVVGWNCHTPVDP
jgi:hypothetical protein